METESITLGDELLDFSEGPSPKADQGVEDSTGSQSVEDSPKDTARSDRIIEFNGERLEVPEDLWDSKNKTIRSEAAVKRALDLRRKVSEQTPAAPESYELIVPDDLQEKVRADVEHPLASPAMDWAKKHGLSQDAFSELASLFYHQEASTHDADVKYEAEQRDILKKALGDDAERVTKDLGKWVYGLLGKDFKENTGLHTAANMLACDANGVLLIKALKDKLGETAVPSSRGHDAASLSESDLAALQASDAYHNENHPQHKSVVARVREGWKVLFPE